MNESVTMATVALTMISRSRAITGMPLLAEGASVTLVASIAPQMAIETFNATKAALRAFACSRVVDFRPRDIQINVLSSGHIDTPGLNGLLNSEQKSFLAGETPLGRLGAGDDIGEAAVFLASSDSAFVTGTELIVDGGMSHICSL
jgi:NAD(P)-dependent dehydrogenase (short-subunit alcohol dehydrogenase family)